MPVGFGSPSGRHPDSGRVIFDDGGTVDCIPVTESRAWQHCRVDAPSLLEYGPGAFASIGKRAGHKCRDILLRDLKAGAIGHDLHLRAATRAVAIDFVMFGHKGSHAKQAQAADKYREHSEEAGEAADALFCTELGVVFVVGELIIKGFSRVEAFEDGFDLRDGIAGAD